MGTTLQNGVYLPNEGERNCYAGLKTNWEILDQKVADVTALQQAVAGALHREIVASLPTTDIDPNTIYMILSGTSATENVYNEFMYVNNAWELIGTSATDLTNYYTKGDVDGLLVLKANASDLTSHTGDTTIHVTSGDKSKWNTVALIKQLRLVNAQVGSSTTIAFANIDDINGIKVGDKCMDLDGRMFEITAVDTTNQTVTVGTALVDLALDANVVHTSGSETIGGAKTFSDNLTIYNSNTSANTPNLTLQSLKIQLGDTSNSDIQSIVFNARSSFIAKVDSFKDTAGTQNLQNTVRTKDASNNIISAMYRLRLFNSGFAFLESNNDNTISLGRNNSKWKDCQTYLVNGLTPSSLGMPVAPSSTSYVDISGYITVLDSSSANTYTPPSNGYITFSVTGKLVQILHDYGLQGKWTVQAGSANRGFIPVLGGVEVEIYITASTVDKFWFIPCQGNI